MTTRAPPAKSNRSPLHTLTYNIGTSEQVGYAFGGSASEAAKMYSRRESK